MVAGTNGGAAVAIWQQAKAGVCEGSRNWLLEVAATHAALGAVMLATRRNCGGGEASLSEGATRWLRGMWGSR